MTRPAPRLASFKPIILQQAIQLFKTDVFEITADLRQTFFSPCHDEIMVPYMVSCVNGLLCFEAGVGMMREC